MPTPSVPTWLIIARDRRSMSYPQVGKTARICYHSTVIDIVGPSGFGCCALVAMRG